MVFKGPHKFKTFHKAIKKKKSRKPDRVFVRTHLELLTEMQVKYTELYTLSQKTNHELLEVIGRTIMVRLKRVSDATPEVLVSGFELSKAYRRFYPHSGDFELILSTLHMLQDAVKAPRTQMVESDLIRVPSSGPYFIDNVPYEEVKPIILKYSDRISEKIASHLNSLQTDIGSGSEEDTAKKIVRKELKRMSPNMPWMIRNVILEHFLPQTAPFRKMRIYGEPYVPSKQAMVPFLRKYRTASAKRSHRMYNLLRFSMPLLRYSQHIKEMDGTVINGAKLITRSAEANLYKPSKSLIAEMRAYFGVKHSDADQELILQEHDESDSDDEAIVVVS